MYKVFNTYLLLSVSYYLSLPQHGYSRPWLLRSTLGLDMSLSLPSWLSLQSPSTLPTLGYSGYLLTSPYHPLREDLPQLAYVLFKGTKPFLVWKVIESWLPSSTLGVLYGMWQSAECRLQRAGLAGVQAGRQAGGRAAELNKKESAVTSALVAMYLIQIKNASITEFWKET